MQRPISRQAPCSPPAPSLGLVAAAVAVALAGGRARAGSPTLPVACPCTPAGSTAVPFVGYGAASAAQSGSKLTVTQGSSSALLNWQSFSISAGGTVQFVQPSPTSVAINKVVLSNPSSIFGALNANGQVFLINPNGILFGSTAQVNVGSLVASALDIPASDLQLVLTDGLTAPLANGGQPAFSGSSTNGSITVQQGASIQTPAGGTILMFAPTVANQGTLEAPGGQVMLAGGTSVYLASSTDPTLRGLLVEVSGDGTVTNGTASNANVTSAAQLVGQIVSSDGNVTLAALAVNQEGLVSATTSVRENGSIVLQARTGSASNELPSSNQGGGNLVASSQQGTDGYYVVPGTGGTLTVGPNSVTAVTLDTADTETTVDSVPQPKSDVEMFASNVQIQSGATVTATSGSIDVTALLNQSAANVGQTSQSDGSSIYVAPNATLDVSGASVTLPASSVAIPVKLEGTELADFPLQQNLLGQTIYVDSLLYGTRSDGSTWVGTPLADVSSDIAAIPQNVQERNLTGGTVSLQSQGDAVVASGATINISGGATHYTAGYLDTTELETTTGTEVNISQADPDLEYVGIAAPTLTVTDPKWGVADTYTLPGIGPSVQYQAAFTVGADAGTMTLVTPRFVLDGTIDGQATVGQYQRTPPILNPADWPENLVATADAGTPTDDEMYRPYDEVPLSGALIIGDASPQAIGPSGGSDYILGNVTFASGAVLPGLTAAGFDPATDQLPASYTTSVLQPDLFGPEGVGQLTVYSDGSVSVPAGVHLDFPAGGALSITANTIDVEGSVSVPGGDIAMAATNTFSSPAVPDATELPSIELGPEGQLTALGAWVNDSEVLNPNGPSGPLFLNGGSISLSVQGGNLTLAPGSLIDVSGGAQLTSAAAMTYGSGGTIALGATPYNGATALLPTTLDIGGTLRGYAEESGGTLNLTADTVCIAASDCTGGDPSVLWLAPSFFDQGGFGNYVVNTSYGGLTVAPGTVIDLVQQNLLAPANPTGIPSAAAFEPLASQVVLPVLLREPTSLTLSADVSFPASTGSDLTSESEIDQLPSLQIGTGAVISADPLAGITLKSDTRIIDDGSIQAPDGSVTMTLTNTLPVSTYDATQAIWLGSDATVDVAGVPDIISNDNGISTGSVLPGGSVTLTAQRGYIEMLSGSVINVSGATAVLGQWETVGSTLQRVDAPVASAGGSVSLTAAEGMSIDGTFEASAGTGASRTPAGGSLTVALDPSTLSYGTPGTYQLPAGETQTSEATQYAPETIVLSDSGAPTAVAPGAPVSDSMVGEALVSAATLTGAGFANESFSAGVAQLVTSNGQTTETGLSTGGILSIPQNVALQTGESITLDVGEIQVGPGVTGALSAPYVSIGNSDSYVASDFQFQNPSSGTGALQITGTQLVDLYGTFALQGIGTAQLDSSGDIRLIGVAQPNITTEAPSDPLGELLTAGDIELQAAQVYPTTLTQFTIASTAANGTIDVEKSSSSAPPDSVWSAGGTLILSAATITQNGDLRAPFGTITLEGPPSDVNGGSITLGPGSLTSTSADGLTIPFGTTEGGFDWTYPLPDGAVFVYGTDGIPPPSQAINLVGNQIDVGTGATIDVSGGGDLMAYEFEPDTTTGGNTDILAATSGLYAIVPTIDTSVAPYDPNISNGSTLRLGQSIYLSGSPGLPAGTYTLLPARYALLPGAFLVEPAGASYAGIAPGEQFANPGGGTIVAGYETIAGTSIADSNTSGFAVIPASVFDQEATYTTTLASQFFTTQAQTAAQTDGTPVSLPRLPADAGVLTLAAASQLTLAAGVTLDTTPGTGGLGAQVDIASTNIDVVPSSSTPQASNAITLPVASLEQLGAQTLLLGGESGGSGIETLAQNVTIESGVQLSAPQILLAATNEVDVQSGASLTASGSAPPPSSYTLSGDGAFLSVSASPVGTLTRTNSAGGTAVLDLEAGSEVTAPQGSLYLDADNVLTNGTLALNGGDLAVQSSAISLGSPPAGTSASGTALSGSVLDASGLRSLSLLSGTSISVNGDVTVSAQDLTLDGPGLVAGEPGATAVMTATGTLQLSNAQSAQPAASSVAGGTLTLNAQNIELGSTAATGPESMQLSGFSSVALNAQGGISASADSSLSSTTGNLGLSAAVVTTASDVSLGVSSAGALALTAPQAPAAVAPVTSLGGSLQLSGQSVEIGTSIQLPAGSVQLVSTGGASGSSVVLDPGASIDVAGVTRTYNGTTVAAPGGSVSIYSAGDVLLSSGSVIDVSGATGGDAGSLAIAAPAGSLTALGTLEGAGGGGQGGSFSVDANQILDGQGNPDFGQLLQLATTSGFTGNLSFELGQGNLDVASGTTVTASSVDLIADNGNVSVEGTLDVSGAAGGNVLLAASNDVTLSGTIDAYATGAGQSGGQVELEAGTYTLNSAGQLDYGNTGQLQFTGTINVSGGPANSYGNPGPGGIVLASIPQDTAEAMATTGGTGVVWQGSVVGANQTILEPVLPQQTEVAGVISATDEATAYTNASTWMSSNAQGLLAALDLPAGSSLVVEPGIEFDDPTGSLSLSTAWNLFPDRFTYNVGGTSVTVPGILTLRSAGDINIDASLSDGFASTATSAALEPTSSWSYQLVAGADFSSGNIMGVTPLPPPDITVANVSQPGDVAIESGDLVRTGTGFIDIAASGDFTLATQSSVLYTAGTCVAAASGSCTSTPSSYNAATGYILPYGSTYLPYSTGGGNINIDVEGDIDGARSNQFVTSWLWRQGGPGAGTVKSGAVEWSVDFANFQQGVGALGGGNIAVTAGGDITNFSASIPSIGEQIGGTTYADSDVDVVGGGDLSVQAGGSISGGSYYVGLGTGRIVAGGDVSGVGTTSGLGPVLGVGDAQILVQATGNIDLGGIANPTLVPETSGESILYAYWSDFSTYAPDSSVDLISTSGNVTLEDNSSQLESLFTSIGTSEWTHGGSDAITAFNILPPTVTVAALNGNITFGGLLGLFPSPQGSLELLAQNNITAAPTGGSISSDVLILSDADPTLLPSVQEPSATGLGAFEYMTTQEEQFNGTAQTSSSSDNLGIDPDALAPIHGQNETPVDIVATTGNIDFSSAAGTEAGIISSEPADVAAGGNIIDLGLIAQNLNPGDVTSVTAGGSIAYPYSRDPQGLLTPNYEEIAVDGPGALDITAGGSLNLGTSAGIVTRGNLVNPVLPAGGASINVTVGTGADAADVSSFISTYVDDSDQFDAQVVAYMESLTGDSDLTTAEAKQALDQLSSSQQLAFMQYALAPQYAAVISTYIDGSTTYDAALVAYVEQVTGQTNLAASAAKQAFNTLSPELQDLFVDQVVFGAIDTDATEAVSSGTDDYSGAFAALTTLFPGANPDLAAGQTSPYQGDIDMYFSQIYTLAGGNLSLLAPGGDIDVGLSTPPSGFGISKEPQQLGLVAQGPGNVSALAYGDISVNESRVFAADGGNILMWSTEGDLDAGRGSKSAISAPPPTITIGPNGQPIVTFPTALTGSGIQALSTTPGVEPGTVSLFAPHGVVNADEAGIVAGNLVIGATAVLGANNISVSGTAIGLPPPPPALGASLAGASSTGAAATAAAEQAVAASAPGNRSETPVADAALNFLDVIVTGFGEEDCKPDDTQCMQREQENK